MSRADAPIQLSVTSPSADSIVVSSANGLDRYSATGAMLQASLQPDFGDSVPVMRYAARHEGRLLNVVKKPVKVEVCRRHSCQSYYHELSIMLPERNRRSVALTGGWSTNFSQRAIRIPNQGPAQRGAQSASEVNLQAEVAMAGLSARLEGYVRVGGPNGLARPLPGDQAGLRRHGIRAGGAPRQHPCGLAAHRRKRCPEQRDRL